ncbi:hypothetical protein EIP86_004137 [Pleurotus ostreatoroseus]|nr:hypothetical protein EIP86_004137 [Pleurotus ostreatoroseus]
MKPGVNVDISQGIATITFNRPKSLNAITNEDYNDFAEALWAIDKRSDVLVTVWQGERIFEAAVSPPELMKSRTATGRMFCAGTDVGAAGTKKEGEKTTMRETFLTRVARANTDPSKALASHSKLLVAALNGPVFGIAAAFLGHFDFIYCVPEAYLSVPFTFLGIISEAGSSVTFARRMGVAKANEVLMFGKKMTAQELVDCGFVNKIFPSQAPESFHAAVRKHVHAELDSLEPTAVLGVKQLVKRAFQESNDPDAAIMRESYAQAERISSGIPAQRFAAIARKEIRHKL